MAGNKKKQPIFGYVQLRDDFYNKLLRSGTLIGGWRCNPAHHRENPIRLILTGHDPDTEQSYHYHFRDPAKRKNDGSFEIDDSPLPIMSQRDREFFKSQPDRYKIYSAKMDYIEEPEPTIEPKPVPKPTENIASEEVDVKPVTVKKKRGRPSRTETRLVTNE